MEHINNPNETRRAFIRKLKKAFLRLDIYPYKQETGEEVIGMDKGKDNRVNNILIKEKETLNKLVINRKGRSLKEQRARDGTLKLKKDNREEFEVERILKERTNPKTKGKEYLVKWLGYDNRNNTREPVSNLANAPKVLQEWDISKKMTTLSNKKNLKLKVYNE